MESIQRAAAWIGRPLRPEQASALGRYARWLEEEAIPAGGLAPGERARIPGRHVADALTFAVGWRPPAPPPTRLLDLGSGVGLPGIPLAVLFPHTEVVLVDRSGRRCRLARRAGRILSLANVTVVQEEITRLDDRVPAIVSRATMPIGDLRPLIVRLLEPGGTAVVAVSTVRSPDPGEDVVVEVPAGILDGPTWLRIITPQ